MWIVVENTQPKHYPGAFPTVDAAKTYVENMVAEGMEDCSSYLLYKRGWRWVFPEDNPEGEHLWFVNTESPALSIMVLAIIVHTDRRVWEHTMNR